MLDQTLIRAFSNIGHRSGGRNFAGFTPSASALQYLVEPRDAVQLDLHAGDLLQIAPGSADDGLALIVFDQTGLRCETALGLSGLTPLEMPEFQNGPLLGWIASHGGDADNPLDAVRITNLSEPLVLKVMARCTVWMIHPASSTKVIRGEASGAISVLHKRGSDAPLLPPPLGEIRDEFTVSRATARAYEVKQGEFFQIIDVEGQQCSDFQAFRTDQLDRGVEAMIDGTVTRSMVRRAYPWPGVFDKFYDAAMSPMLRLVQDTCGRHDTFGLACTARGYEDRGFPGHVNCSDNISAAVRDSGVAPRAAWPAINFFWNTWIDAHQHILTEESHSRPGDYVTMEALDDLVCVSTACPDDIDPINGWNPTDVHVRIYRPETRITRAVAYRSNEDAPMQISQESAFHERLAPLTDQFAPARDLWLPISFPSLGTIGEYWACREAATLQDMSGLRKFDIAGPDAERLLQLAMTRNIAKLAVWRGTYSLICDESGEVIDDGTLFRLAPHLFRWCCGSEESGRWLDTLARREGLQVRIRDMQGALPNLALQGPKSRDILRQIVFTQPDVPALDQVKWFGATVARLHDRDGAPFLLTRSGYTGELGYEVFCAKEHALTLWDALMEAGSEHGLVPMGSAALDTIRIEAGLAAAGAEFTAGVDAFEAGLGFAVDLKKADFVGREALLRNAAAPRRQLCGLLFDCDDVPAHGAPVYCGERQVGVVTSATRSPLLERTIAMARLSVEHATPEAKLEVGQLDGRMKRLSVTVAGVQFVDPKREKARA
ncbi:DUF1989 domain-containing protein [Actibacterium sp. 188UL27-1]|uniref:DUF1989 domain-containing protein n=1 Tax=Actibacterium sp. 188UL27-1 TaxID=2786961 RepID=UPI001959EFF3|nr:aminomethyltransferase family protein [Actibacterium sp. 188UL27-1]MBM7069420.1 aminomethyltransferase family protein [Actibacterium sp. 188UL27-1]